MTIVDITYTTNIGERHGRRRMYDNHTGEVWWEDTVDMLVEPVDPAPPLVDLLGIREKELDEAFKPLGAKVDAEVLLAVKPAHKPKAKKHGA
jgi:hypothetical protein